MKKIIIIIILIYLLLSTTCCSYRSLRRAAGNVPCFDINQKFLGGSAHKLRWAIRADAAERSSSLWGAVFQKSPLTAGGNIE